MRKQAIYNKPVGIIDDLIYVVHYTFEDKLHDKPFNGVTGDVLSPLTQAYIDYKKDANFIVSSYRYLWKEAVKNGSTYDSLADWVQDNIIEDDYEGEFPGHDTTALCFVENNEQVKVYFPDAISFECIAGGRVFRKNMKWDVIFDEHLVNEINRLESEEY